MPRAESKCIPPWCRKEIQAAPSRGSISIGDKVTRACHCILPGTLATKPNLLPKKILHIRPKITEIDSFFFLQQCFADGGSSKGEEGCYNESVWGNVIPEDMTPRC